MPSRHRPNRSARADETVDRIELRLALSPGPEGSYTVDASSPLGAKQGTMEIPPGGCSSHRSLAPAPPGGRHLATAESPGPILADPRQVGSCLFECLFSDPGVRALYERTCATSSAAHRRLRIVMDPEGEGMEAVHSLPWELLYDRNRGERLACEGGVSIVRSLAVRRPPRPFEGPRHLRLLALFSGAQDLDLDGESRRLEALATTTSGFEVHSEKAEDLATLEKILLRAEENGRPYHVLHLAGHGRLAPGPSGGVLLWESAGRPRVEISGQDLSALLRQFPDLQLVALNACTTAELPGNGHDPFSGVATALLQGGVPVVLGVQGEIGDSAAILFTEAFYRALAGGATPEKAMGTARWRLWISDPEGVEWAKPVLFQATTEEPARFPRWLLHTAAVLAVTLLIVSAAATWMYRALCERTFEHGVEAAHALLLDGHPTAAVKQLEDALEDRPCPGLDPALRATAHAAFASAEQDLGDLRSAVRHAREAVRLAPKRGAHHYNLGTLLARAGRSEDAVAPLHRAVDLDPSVPETRNELGCVYLDLGRPGDARDILEAALDETPEHPLVHKNLGRALLALDEPANATWHLSRSLALLPRSAWPERAEASLHLARARIATGDLRGACDALKQARLADPETATAASSAAARLARIHCQTPGEIVETPDAS